MGNNIEYIDFEDRRKSIVPIFFFTFIFFFFYYLILIIPKFGINSDIFLIDNIGGAFIVTGFILSYILSKRWQQNFILLLPSFGALGTTCLFLANVTFYSSVSHLWLSAQIIGIIYASFLGNLKSNSVLFILYVTIPPILASQIEHLDPMEIIHKQAIVYFASIISLYSAHNSFNLKKELFKAQHEALASIKSKSIFLANMSHEIRTPMNGIIGFSRLLLTSKLTPDQKENAKTINHSALSLLGVLNDILDFSKIESDKLEIEKIPFDYLVVVKDVFRLSEEQAQKKGLEFIKELPSSHPLYLLGDPHRVKQILLNLVSNAIKFTETGTVCITVKSKNLTSNTLLVTASVSDTGIGMSADMVNHIFDSFNQADSSISRKYGGSGLGTTISKKITELMGGELQVQSTKGLGSKFTLYIPFEISTIKDNIEHNNIIPERNYCKTIILAEDNEFNQMLAVKTLENLGITVIVANDGQEAIDLAENKNYDLILMDIQMPNKDGYTAFKELKSKGHTNPIIAMTANVMTEEVEKYMDAGFAGFIPKPFATKNLLKTLDKHFLK